MDNSLLQIYKQLADKAALPGCGWPDKALLRNAVDCYEQLQRDPSVTYRLAEWKRDITELERGLRRLPYGERVAIVLLKVEELSIDDAAFVSRRPATCLRALACTGMGKLALLEHSKERTYGV